MAKGSGRNYFEVESSWIRSKHTLHARARNEEVKRSYQVSVAGSQGRNESAIELEKRWLRKLTGVTSKEYADMWREAVVGAGGVPENSIQANKELYFRLVA